MITARFYHNCTWNISWGTVHGYICLEYGTVKNINKKTTVLASVRISGGGFVRTRAEMVTIEDSVRNKAIGCFKSK